MVNVKKNVNQMKNIMIIIKNVLMLVLMIMFILLKKVFVSKNVKLEKYSVN